MWYSYTQIFKHYIYNAFFIKALISLKHYIGNKFMNKHLSLQITQVFDMLSITNVINKADHTSLVLFDVDDVLIMDEHPYRLTHPYRKQWRRESKARLSEEERNLLFSIILAERNVRLVDPSIVDILGDLEKRKIPTMALTKLYTDKFGVIEKMQDWRIKELNAINIDFSKLTPIKDEILIHGLQVGYGVPVLLEGVILTANRDKADILEHILHEKKYYPKSIIFVDDVLENLEVVQNLCERLKINFHGFEYLAAKQVPEIELDEKSERVRFQILEQKYRWLTEHNLTDIKH